MGSLGAAGSADTARAAWTDMKGEIPQQSPGMCNHPRPRWHKGRCSRKKVWLQRQTREPLPFLPLMISSQ